MSGISSESLALDPAPSWPHGFYLPRQARVRSCGLMRSEHEASCWQGSLHSRFDPRWTVVRLLVDTVQPPVEHAHVTRTRRGRLRLPGQWSPWRPEAL